MFLIPYSRLVLWFLSFLFIGLRISNAQTIRLTAFTLNSNGHDFKNEVMQVRGSISQTLIGAMPSATQTNHQGFWYVYTSIQNKITPLRPFSAPDSLLIIYPNPVHDLLYLDIIATQVQSHCTVVDMSGKVLQSHFISGGRSILNLGYLSSGSYLIRIRNKQFLYARLILKL